jgi:hypothetical protein
MCDALATTREHVPPSCFFPAGYRTDLWTVPACRSHNQDNSPDVEYTRSIIALDGSTNQIARELVRSKVRRSWERSPLLKARTFKRVAPSVVRGQRTAIVEADLPRFNCIISSIAFAIYFRETGVRWQRDWLVYSSTMVAGKVAFEGRPDPLNPPLRATLTDIPFEARNVPQPAVFQYGVFEESTDDLLYRFTFYEGAVVYAIASHRVAAAFRADESLARRPRTPDPCVVRPLGKHRGSGM